MSSKISLFMFFSKCVKQYKSTVQLPQFFLSFHQKYLNECFDVPKSYYEVSMGVRVIYNIHTKWVTIFYIEEIDEMLFWYIHRKWHTLPHLVAAKSTFWEGWIWLAVDPIVITTQLMMLWLVWFYSKSIWISCGLRDLMKSSWAAHLSTCKPCWLQTFRPLNNSISKSLYHVL